MPSTLEKVHMIGIGGTGMSSIAKVLLQMGCKVSGSDLSESITLSELRELGASIYIGHAAEQLNGATQVVVSTAIDGSNPELQEARRKNIPVLHRSEVLAYLLNEREGIAVAGAHGKTTITAMISYIMEKAGVDPTAIIGGRLGELGGGAKFGRGKYLVAEADESDGSFVRYKPAIGVVTQIEPDHLENHNGSFQNLVRTYEKFLHNIRPTGLAVLGYKDSILISMADAVDCSAVSYGLQNGADYQARNIKLMEYSSSFTVYYRGKKLGKIELGVPGKHNVENSLAAIAVCRAAGLPFSEIARCISGFHGVHRRFEVVDVVDDILIVDDYAHHPTEIDATLQTARDSYQRRVIVVFQPHRYSRTKFLMREFSQSFTNADVIVLTDIYAPPPEKPIPGVTIEHLARLTKEASDRPVHLVKKRADLLDFLSDIARPGDIILTLGAGDITTLGPELARRLRSARLAAQ